MTTDHLELELGRAWANLRGDEITENAVIVVAYELRALRFMLKDELRELGWPRDVPIASLDVRAVADLVQEELAKRARRTGSLFPDA